MTSPRRGLDGSVERATWAVLAIKVTLFFWLAWRSRIVMDEYWQLGFAKYLGHGLFETIQPAKAAGTQLFFSAAFLMGHDATSIMLAGRLMTALLSIGTMGLLYGCARALGRDRLRALVIVLVALCFSNFIERAFRTISEPLSLFFAMAALCIVLRYRTERAAVLLAAGLASGLSFLATQKGVYFNVALGVGLVGEAVLRGQWREGIRRGFLLVAGWLAAVVVYCLAFGGLDPIPVARNLVFGPVNVATKGADAYHGLRQYVVQTLTRNSLLYLLCFAGLGIATVRWRKQDGAVRIALLHTWVVTALVFAHNQPWPYVFIMAIPFLALWSTMMFDSVADGHRVRRIAAIILVGAIAMSFVRNVQFWAIDNDDQRAVMARADALLRPGEPYFDGTGMLPDHPEPSTLWLDRAYVLKTLAEGRQSEAYRIFSEEAPRLVIWTYRMDAIAPVVNPLVQETYVKVAPNIRIMGQMVDGEPRRVTLPRNAVLDLYDSDGRAAPVPFEVDGRQVTLPLKLGRGRHVVRTLVATDPHYLLEVGKYAGLMSHRPDHDHLFDGVYQ